MFIQNDTVIDAVDIRNDTTVAIKRIDARSRELGIMQLLSSEERRANPSNHCVPLLNHFYDDEEGAIYLVLPLLRAFDDPPFQLVEEVVEFVRQTLEVSTLLLFVTK